MLKTILVGLDGSEDSRPAIKLALAWGKAHDARVIGFAVYDEPGVLGAEGALLGGGDHGAVDRTIESEARSRVDEVIRGFQDQAARAEVRSETLLARGTPHEQLLTEAHRFDLVMLGKRTHFEYGWRNGSDATLERVVQECSRPVVVVPPPESEVEPGPVVAAFDGSVHASRALYAFEASGLARSRVVHVVCVDKERGVAERTAERGAEFLRNHEVDARPLPFDGEFPPLEAILGATIELSASLLVMGAYGHSQLRELLLGSTTRTVFGRSTVPVFCAR
jgi:nucleotide-binding universal stress UspA family protein